MLHSLVFSAKAFPIGHGTEDARAKQAVALGFECAVVDCFRFRDVAMRPRTNLLRRSETDANRFEIRCKCFLSCISHHNRLFSPFRILALRGGAAPRPDRAIAVREPAR